MNWLQQFPDLGSLGDLHRNSSLLPEPYCARLSDVFALVEPRLGTALLDVTGRAELRSVADHVPALFASFWGLEIRLGDPIARADLLWEVSQGNAGISTLAGRNCQDQAADVTSALRERSSFWRKLGRFAEEWLDNPEWLGRLGNIWLEVDLMSGAELDACLDQPNLFWGPNHRVTGSDRDLLGHLGTLGRRFYGLELDQARLDTIIHALPQGGKVFQMGVMGARTMPATRLCVKMPDEGMHERWLAEIGWPGDRSSLHDTLSRLKPLSGEIALNVDILPDRMGERLGLEIYSTERTLSMDPWQPLNDELLAWGLARADKLAALREFPWFQMFRQFGAWLRTPPYGFPAIATNLHHLKLVFVGDAVLETKAYLGVTRPLFDYSPTQGHEMEGGGGWL